MARATFSPETRERWGFFDGMTGHARGRFNAWGDMDRFCARHFDKRYAKGYRKGWEQAAEARRAA